MDANPIIDTKEKPYVGLIPYSESDAEYFFGRDREQKVITANLMASRLTLLYGASGVGKSSVLRAGVSRGLQILATQNLKLLGTPEYIGVGFSSWRDNPTMGLLNRVDESIKAVLKEARVGRFFDDDDDDDEDAPQTLAESLQALARSADATLLIALDQFEEYFLYEPQHTEERSFAVELAQAINTQGLDANFLISIREDSLAKLDTFRERIPNLFDNYLRIDHLDYKAAREAIEEPIKKYNTRHSRNEPYTIEPELVSDVLDQIQTGHLLLDGLGRGIITDRTKKDLVETPYLQIVMTRLWDQTVSAGSYTLERRTLIELGGAKKIIQSHLDAAMSALSDEEQKIAARVFNYLVTPSGTKIAYTASDLAAYSKRQEGEILPMLEKLASGDARVLRTVPPPADKPNADHRYEIFHDVLASPILAWRTQFEQKEKNAEVEKLAWKNVDRAIDELNESERDIASSIFSALITSSGSRAALTIDDLASSGKLPIDAVRKVVARLSVPDREILHAVDPGATLTYYEISNEILAKPIMEWCDGRRARRLIESPESVTEEASYAGRTPLIVITLYYMTLIALATYGLYVFWHRGELDPSNPPLARYLFWTFSISLKTRLVAIALFSGLFGSTVHGLRSFVNYKSERVFVWASFPRYISIPLLGPFFALILLLTLQAGVFDKDIAGMAANPIGVAVVAALAGMAGPSYLSQIVEKAYPKLSEKVGLKS